MPGASGEVGELLRRLDASPYLRIERRTDRVILRVRGRVVAALDLESRSLSVDVPADTVGPLLERYPRSHGTDAGVGVDVSDRDGRLAAEALVRWRVERERYAPQMLAASP